MSIIRFLFPTLIAIAALPATAAERTLTGAEILALLPTITALGKGTTQVFEKNGVTEYTDPRGDSIGYWQPRSDQYCSNWPPSATWVCYDVLVDDDDPSRLIWMGDSGKPTINRMKPRADE